MKRISSKSNPILKEAVSLLRRKYRDKLKLYHVEGEKIVREALEAGLVTRLFVEESQSEKHADLLDQAQNIYGADVVILSDQCFSLLESTMNSQGLLAIARQREPSQEEWDGLLDSEPVNVLVLDSVQDPGNVGSLIRTAVASGFMVILMTKGTADPYSPKITRAASGLNRLPFIKMVDGPDQAIEWLRKHNKKILVADARGRQEYYKSKYSQDLGLVMGNEGSGIDPKFIDAADEIVYIPMLRGVESLNVAVAGGILMYSTAERKAKCKNEMQK